MMKKMMQPRKGMKMCIKEGLLKFEQRNHAEDLDDIREVTTVQRNGVRRTTTALRNTQGKQEKRPKKGARI
jgi:hypothetical protein